MTTRLANSKKLIDWNKVSFPVYKLGKREPTRQGSLVLYEHEAVDDEGFTSTIRYIDDLSKSGNSIGTRRLILKSEGYPLHRITQSLPSVKDVLAMPTNTWFIDNSGKVFQLHKSHRCKLTCAKITNILPLKDGVGCSITVKGLLNRYRLLYRPKSTDLYAGILHYAGGTIIYGLFSEPFKDTWRKA